MPRQTASTTTSILAKLGQRGAQAYETHKRDEVEQSNFEDLPAGINGGVARLVDIKFDKIKEGKTNAGEVYFYAAGVVVAPKEHNGELIEGRRTSIMEILAETPERQGRKTLDEHMKWVIQQLKKLGLETENVQFNQLESAVEMIKQAQPYFKFRTWLPPKSNNGQEPRTVHFWNGAVDFSGNGEVLDDVADNSPTAQDVEVPETDAETTVIEETTAGAFDEFNDLDALVAKAEGGDEEAQAQLREMAIAAGTDEDAVDAAESWAVVAEMVQGTAATKTEEEPAPAPAPEAQKWTGPKKGEVYKYRPVITDPKTKKQVKSRKAVECDVVAVAKKGETCDLKSLDDGKVFKAVKWDELESAE
jgi:hypothetical protein